MKEHTAHIVAITLPRIEGISRPSEFIAYAARVSNPGNQMNTMTGDKLLKYCAKNKHWSVFEMCNIVMEINTTRDIARQILRHRSFSFQEFSQRYADPTDALGFSYKEARLQDEKNRQNSLHVDDDKLKLEWLNKQNNVLEAVKDVYKWGTENGIAKEQLRAVLPEGITRSRMYMNGTLRSWIHYCQIRTEEGTQKEHREVALDAWYQILGEFKELESLQIGKI